MNVNNPRKPPDILYKNDNNENTIYVFIPHPTYQPNPNEWYGMIVDSIRNDYKKCYYRLSDERIKKYQNIMINNPEILLFSSYPKSIFYKNLTDERK